jgi:hypothetical protein
VSFFTLGGAVLSLLKTSIGAGAELFSFGSRRGHVGVVSPYLAPSISKLGEFQLFRLEDLINSDGDSPVVDGDLHRAIVEPLK